MLSGILVGIFGNGIYDIIKFSIKDTLLEKDDDFINRIYNSIEEASKLFFTKFGNEFGEPSESFLARQSNIDIIVKSCFYGNSFELIKEISPQGFDLSENLTYEALYFFVSKLDEVMMKDFRLNKIITEKRHINESKENSNKIMNLLNSLVQQNQKSGDITKENSFRGWAMKDASGNDIPFVEGKKYIAEGDNGVEISCMFKNGQIYVDFTDIHGQKSYYELDIDGNVKDSKFPHDLSEYKLIIPEEQIVNKNTYTLSNGFYREVIKLKWDKQADVIFNSEKKIQQINLHGGWKVSHLERTISPSE
jgi:hypothetical protein